MTRYLEIKPGSISETIKRLSDDYQAVFKAELEKTGKGIAQMTDAEKKAFFNKIDKMHNAKNEAMDSSWIKKEIDKEKKTTLVAAPGNKEKVIRIPKEKLADYKAKGYVEAESYIPEAKKIDELTAGQKKLPPALQKAIKAKEKKEAVNNPYAVGMAAAMKATGDKPPLKKSTIVKAHDIAKSIEKKEEVEINEITDEEEKNYGRQITSLSNDKVMARINKKGDEAIAAIQAKIDSIRDERNKKRTQKNEEVEITEGQFKEIDTRKGDLKLAKDKKQNLKDKYNAIMAGQATGDENAIADQIQKLEMSIKKQEQELIDIMKKQRKSKK
jgi:hypothetical protein